jgi:hypothetical protein
MANGHKNICFTKYKIRIAMKKTMIAVVNKVSLPKNFKRLKIKNIVNPKKANCPK